MVSRFRFPAASRVLEKEKNRLLARAAQSVVASTLAAF